MPIRPLSHQYRSLECFQEDGVLCAHLVARNVVWPPPAGVFFFFIMIRPPPRFTLFPHPPLFRFMDYAPPPIASFVALGDSFTEGMNDPAPGGGYRGWADRLAEVLAARDQAFRYANLAVRGKML